jgi:bifunctional non-homologous end joining protein LigD
MLACTRTLPTGTEGWAYGVKWDGARMQVRFDGGAISMRSRYGRACADEFPEVAALAEVLAGRRIVLDGELVCLAADGKPDFGALRARFGRRDLRGLSAAQRRSPVRLIVFDVLHLDGVAVRELPYAERRELLEELALDGPAWCTPRQFRDNEGEALIAATAAQGLEGVMAKRLDAPYRPGRRRSAWIKHKHRRREWLVIAGWRERPGTLPEFLLARRRGGYLVPAGSASLGLAATQRAALIAALSDHELPARGRRGSVRWVQALIEVSADVHGCPGGPVRGDHARDP